MLEGVTSEDIVEMMAFERLEPFGSLHTEQLFGQVCSTLLMPHLKDGAKPPPPSHFFPALRRFLDGYKPRGDSILLDDPEEQSRLIKQMVFGVGE